MSVSEGWKARPPAAAEWQMLGGTPKFGKRVEKIVRRKTYTFAVNFIILEETNAHIFLEI